MNPENDSKLVCPELLSGKWAIEANLPGDAGGATQNPDINQVGLSGIVALKMGHRCKFPWGYRWCDPKSGLTCLWHFFESY